MTIPTGPRLERLDPPGPTPYRLGRHVQHDPRSRRFAAPVLPRSAIISRRWERRVAVFDQQDWSACVGMAMAGWAATDNTTRHGLTQVDGVPISSGWARDVVYHLATQRDEFDWEWPPTDEGSSGLGGVKALQQLGLCGTYIHPFTLQAVLTGLQDGPVPVGTVWRNSMFTPMPDGRIPVDPSSAVAGGHEYLADELDVDAGLVWVTNSWGDSWGANGRGYLMLEDLAALLAEDGDAVIPAAPTTAPPPPAQPAAGCIPGAITNLFRRSRP